MEKVNKKMQKQYILKKSEFEYKQFLKEGEVITLTIGYYDPYGEDFMYCGLSGDDTWVFHNGFHLCEGEVLYDGDGKLSFCETDGVMHDIETYNDYKINGEFCSFTISNVICRGLKDGVEVTIL